LAAVKKIADAQRSGSRGALLALALVRDEAPSLPSVVSPQGRIYAWFANTWRRLTDDPLKNVWRFVFALLGATLAMAIYVFVTFRSEAIFNAERWGRTISIGLTFGMMIAILTLIAGELPARLRGFWPGWARLAFSAIAGFLWGTLAWGAFTWFFLNYPPVWEVMAYAGLGTALGFVLSSLFGLRGWLGVLITAVAMYIPIYLMFQFYFNSTMPPLPLSNDVINNPSAILYFDDPAQIFTLAIPIVLLIALGAHFPAVLADVRALWKRVRAKTA